MSNPTYITFDYALFQQQVPEYSNAVTYPSATINVYWDLATYYISSVGNFGSLQGAARAFAINLMTGHLIYLDGLVTAGQVPGLMQTATIDKVSIGLTPPPLPNQWQWWMNQTSYGQRLLALLLVRSSGGFYVGGSPQLAAFNYPGGFYGY